jgi:hypothetical protein
MANKQSTNKEAAFSTFEWNKDGAERATITSGPAVRLAGSIRSTAGGVGVILELIEHDLVLNNQRLLNDYQIGALLRLAISATRGMDGEAASFTNWIEKHHMPEELAIDLH